MLAALWLDISKKMQRPGCVCPAELNTMRSLLTRVSFGLLALGLVGCEQLKSSNPLSPAVAGPMAGVFIDAPQLIQPAAGVKIDDNNQPVALSVGVPETNTERPIVIAFQVAFDSAFASIATSQSGLKPGSDGRIRVVLDRLPPGRTYYWRAKADDGANDSGWSDPATFEVLQTVVIGIPTPKSPVGNALVSGQTPDLVAKNGVSSGPTGSRQYHYQVSDNQSFSNVIVNGSILEDPSGETHYVTSPLPVADKTYFWRVRIVGERHSGEWSRVDSFRTQAIVVAPPPGSGGGTPPPGAISQCGPPSIFEPLSILQCHRQFYSPQMSHSERITFLRGALKSLNAAKVDGGPFGLLRKTGGNNCDGYSCDVICAGQGSQQKQWDVLISEEIPTWGAPATDGIRVDVCEIQ